MSIERSALDALVERFARAWNDRDVAALSAALSEDAEFLDSAGKIWRGRPAIIAEHRRIFKHASAQSMLRFQTAKVRLLSRTTALIYAIWSITGNADGRAPYLPVRTGLWLFVAQRRGGAAWQIACCQVSDTPA